MKRLATRLCCLLSLATLLCLAPTSAYGWNAVGHKVVASIAFRRLTAAEQEKVVAILKSHPRFEADFEEEMPDAIADGQAAERNEWLFQQAAVWPDIARGFPRAQRDKFHRPNWHFINLPLFLTPADEEALKAGLTVNVSLVAPALNVPPEVTEKMNVIQAIRYARNVLANPAAKKADKALMLSWLFHLVGDVHQPLHSTAMFSRQAFPKGDHGGNSIHTEQRKNLHSLWDSLLGQSVSPAGARKKALTLVAGTGMEALGKEAAGNLNEEAWLKESHQLANDQVYDADVMTYLSVVEREVDGNEVDPLDLPDSYLQAAGSEANKRVVQAGFRLGAILKALVAE
jgi:hypothetical protein